MRPADIAQMEQLETDHWWYRSLRDLIHRTLAMPRFKLRPGSCVLDAGCGTGANLALLRQVLKPRYLGGFDLSPQAVSLSRAKSATGDSDIYVGDLREPEVRTDRLDLVLSCDVLSIAGIDQCMRGLAQLVDRLRPGGLLVLHLPAYGWLRGAHDVAIGTRDRVTTAQVSILFEKLGLSTELLTYRICFLFPAVVAARLPAMLRRGLGGSLEASSDLHPVPTAVNAGLLALCQVENRAICRGTRFPFGSSVYAVGRK